MTDKLSAWEPRVLSLLRIVAGLLFLEHGMQKLLGFPASEYAGIALSSLPGIAGVLELVLGAIILIGLFTRLAAFLASGEMAVGYWMAHAPQNPFPVNNGGDAAILFCFVFLYIVFRGAGPWSLDAVRARAWAVS
ncbi:MAG TPA: DoxX family protein [Allosphingosinicella sp.]